jgi:hypothetical protein
VAIEPIQAGTGTPSPDNVRAITGWYAVEVARTDGNGDNADTHTITLPTTVYGGTLDVTKGILTVDRASVTLDGSETFWSGTTTSSGVKRFYTTVRYTDCEVVMCDSLNPVRSWTTADCICINEGRLLVTPTWAQSVSDVAGFRTLLASNPIQAVYTLATPQTYTLTPTEVKTLLGENRIYADAGQVMVQYRVDFNAAGLMYIPKAPTADGSYRLTADVTGGTPTYRWEAAE